LRAEDDRHIREGLSEDELELFDLRKKDKMTQEQKRLVLENAPVRDLAPPHPYPGIRQLHHQCPALPDA
jgi:hypothetical protein